MDTDDTRHRCSRCRRGLANEEICSGCISELLDLHDHRIGWKVALEIENEEREGQDLSIEIQ